MTTGKKNNIIKNPFAVNKNIIVEWSRSTTNYIEVYLTDSFMYWLKLFEHIGYDIVGSEYDEYFITDTEMIVQMVDDKSFDISHLFTELCADEKSWPTLLIHDMPGLGNYLYWPGYGSNYWEYAELGLTREDLHNINVSIINDY